MLGLLFLCIVIVPGIGIERNHAMRWVNLGFFTFQPSELAKLTFIIYIAGYIDKHVDNLKQQWYWVIIPIVLPTGVYAALLIIQPDFGSALQVASFALAMTFWAGANLWGVLILFMLFSLVFVIFMFTEPYRVERLLQFLDPWQDPFDKGYNLTQSLMSIGRGDFLGVGLGNSIHKFGYLPEAHTDFIVSILAEEWGMVGVIALLLLYSIIIWRLIALTLLAQRQAQLFAAMVSLGISLWLFFQVFVNIAGASQLLPPKGLVLPFFSQGGSFIISFMMALGIILNIEKGIRSATADEQAMAS